jgi:SAM-dependent methyltransferase
MALPFRDRVFDVVLAIHVLHLVDDHQQALREIARVLGPGGRVLVTTNQYAARTDTAALAPAGWQVVSRRWNDILLGLGVDRARRPRGRWVPDEAMVAALQTLGASAERVVLATYDDRRTARQVAAAHRDRVFSSDWETPDAVHAEATRRLSAWLDTEHAAPDAPFGETMSLAVLIGTFPS